MNRREFLKLISTLAGTAFFPAPLLADHRSINNPVGEPAGQMRTADSGFPRFGIVAIGGAACSIVTQKRDGLPLPSKFVAIDTKPFSLYRTLADRYVWVGSSLEKPNEASTARFLAKAAKFEIIDALRDIDVLFLIAGLGGASGTGISPVILEAAKELGILTIATPITPFSFEGIRRNQVAQAGLNAIKRRSHATIQLPNERFASEAGDELMTVVLERAADAFGHLYRSVSTTLSQNGLIGIDLSDFRTATANEGSLAAFGYASGDSAQGASQVFDAAVRSSLLGASRLKEAKRLFVSMAAKPEHLAISCVNEVMARTRNLAPNAFPIFGAVGDESALRDFSISIIAT